MMWTPLWPTIVLTAGALGLLLVEAFRRPGSAHGMAWGAMGITGAGLGVTLALAGEGPVEGFHRMVVWDRPAFWFSLAVLLGTGMAILLSRHYLVDRGLERGEYYALLLLASAGMLLMAVAGDLLIVFLALEWLSFPLYVLTGFARPRAESEEAALKYFLLGAFASAPAPGLDRRGAPAGGPRLQSGGGAFPSVDAGCV
jgi:NADH-quinone oxidoreductase subunit N